MATILITIYGLCLGSFIHVVINRFRPNKTQISYLKSIIFERSKCENCQSILTFWELIPVLSWCLLQRKCRYCGVKISFHYLLMEVLFSCYCLLTAHLFGVTSVTLILILLSTLLIILSIIDIKYYLLPDIFISLIALLGFIAIYFNILPCTFLEGLISLVLGYLILFVPRQIFYLIKKKHGLGYGDVKLFAALNVWIGYSHLPFTLSLACIIGLAFFLVYFLINHVHRNVIPFGPSLMAATYLVLLSKNISYHTFLIENMIN